MRQANRNGCIARNDGVMASDTEIPRDDPRKVSQYMLDRSGHAIMAGDLTLYLSCFILPHRIQTFEGQRVVPDTPALTDIFHEVRRNLLRLGATTLERRCTQAVFLAPDRVRAHHESRILSGTQIVLRPFPALTELHFVNGDWRVGDCQYAIADAPLLVAALLGEKKG